MSSYWIIESNDQVYLSKIAKTDVEPGLRKAAVKKLSDQTILIDIAQNDTHGEVREAAVIRIED